MGKRENDREVDLERRESEVAAREADLAERMQAAQAVLAAADERDALADARDLDAAKRDGDLNLAELLAPPHQEVYGDRWPERRSAGLDRSDAEGDRTASHADRVALTEGHTKGETDQS
jgi:hypothetical protein